MQIVKKTSSISNEYNYAVFACPKEKNPQIVIASPNPIKGKLIESNFGYE